SRRLRRVVSRFRDRVSDHEPDSCRPFLAVTTDYFAIMLTSFVSATGSTVVACSSTQIRPTSSTNCLGDISTGLLPRSRLFVATVAPSYEWMTTTGSRRLFGKFCCRVGSPHDMGLPRRSDPFGVVHMICSLSQ